MPALTRNRKPIGRAGTPEGETYSQLPSRLRLRVCASPSARVHLSTCLLFLRGPKNMRITRPLAKAAVAAVVVTSAIGLVGSSAASAAPVIPSAAPALTWLERELTDNGGSLLLPPFPGFPPAVDWGLTIDVILALN